MTTYMLSALYGTVRVRNGQLNYQGSKEGILFNAGTDQEESIGWTEFSKKLIEKYGKKQKPVKMAAVDEPEELTIQEVITMFHDEHPEAFTKMMRAIRPAKNNQESAFMAQKVLAPNGFRGFSGPGMMSCEFRSLSAGAEFEYKGRTLNTSYRYLASQARLMYDPFSPEFDDSEERCQLAAGPQDEKQQSDIAESARTEECPTGNNEIPKYIVDFAPIIQGNWPEFLKDIPVPTDTELTCYLYDQEKDLKKMVEIEKEEGLPHMMIMRQRMVVAGLRLLKKMIENMENEK
jgi:hypothetical protein